MPGQTETIEQNIAARVIDALEGLSDEWETGTFEADHHPADDTRTVVLVLHYPYDPGDELGIDRKGRTAYSVEVKRTEGYDEP